MASYLQSIGLLPSKSKSGSESFPKIESTQKEFDDTRKLGSTNSFETANTSDAEDEPVETQGRTEKESDVDEPLEINESGEFPKSPSQAEATTDAEAEKEPDYENRDESNNDQSPLTSARALIEANVFSQGKDYDEYKRYMTNSWRKSDQSVIISGASSKHLKSAMERTIPGFQHFGSTCSDEEWIEFLAKYRSFLVTLPSLREYRFAIDRRTLQLIHFKSIENFLLNRHIKVTSIMPKTLCTIVRDITGSDQYDEIYTTMESLYAAIRQIYLDRNSSLRRGNSTFTPKTEISQEVEAPHNSKHSGHILLGRFAEPIFGLPIFLKPACSICHVPTTNSHPECVGSIPQLCGFQYIKDQLLPVNINSLELNNNLDSRNASNFSEYCSIDVSSREVSVPHETKPKFPQKLAHQKKMFLGTLSSGIDCLEKEISQKIDELLDGFKYDVVVSPLSNIETTDPYFKHIKVFGSNYTELCHYHYLSNKHGGLEASDVADHFIANFETAERCIYSLLTITNANPDISALKNYYYTGLFRSLRPSRELFHFVSGGKDLQRFTEIKTLYFPRLFKKLFAFFTVLRSTFLMLKQSDNEFVFLTYPEWSKVREAIGLERDYQYVEFKSMFSSIYESQFGKWSISLSNYCRPEEIDSIEKLMSSSLFNECVKNNMEWFKLLKGGDSSVEAFIENVAITGVGPLNKSIDIDGGPDYQLFMPNLEEPPSKRLRI